MPKVDKLGNTVTTVRLKADSLLRFKMEALRRDMSLRELLQAILDEAARKMK